MSRIPSCAVRLVLTIFVTLGALGAGVAFAGNGVGSVNFTLGGKRLSNEWFLSTPQTSADGDTLSARTSQPAMGVELSWGRRGWPVLIALDVLHSYDDGVQRYRANSLYNLPTTDVRRRASTLEIGLGARRTWNFKGYSPYFGAGGSWVRGIVLAEMIDPAQSQFGVPGLSINGRHSALGYWVGGGLYRRLGPRLQMGLTARVSRVKMAFPERGEVVGHQDGYQFVNRPFKKLNPADPAGGPPLIFAPDIEAGGRHIGVVVGWSFPSRK